MLFSVVALAIAGIFVAAHNGSANSTYLAAYDAAHGNPPNTTSCSFCHTSPPSLNATGQTLLASANPPGSTNFDYCSIGPATGSCAPPPQTCTSFTYSDWGACQPDGTQTRTVISSSPAGCTGGTPVLSQTCTYVPPPSTCTSFTYSDWGACQPDGTQTRTVVSSSPTGCTGGSPVLTQSCTYVPPSQTCTSFTYSDWGACQPDGTQTRMVVSSSPAGCTGGTPVLSQSCTYVPPGPTQGLGIWVGRWFEVTLRSAGHHFRESMNNDHLGGMESDGDRNEDENKDAKTSQGSQANRDSVRTEGYLKIWSLSPDGNTLYADLYTEDGKGGWYSEPFPFQYVTGRSNIDFICSYHETSGGSTTAFSARIRGTLSDEVLIAGTFRTLKGYYVEKNQESGGYWAGDFSVNGSLIAESEVPVPSTAITH